MNDGSVAAAETAARSANLHQFAEPILLSANESDGFRSPSSSEPIRWRELVVLVSLVAVADVTIYRGAGYAGVAALLVIAPLLLLFASVARGPDTAAWILLPMILVSAARLVWLGSPIAVAAGFAVLFGFVMCLAGVRPHIPEAWLFAAQLILAGLRNLRSYVQLLVGTGPKYRGSNWLAVALPLVITGLFASLFTLANPDLWSAVTDRLSRVFADLPDWILDYSPRPTELFFCGAAAWLVAGMLRPPSDRSGMSAVEAIRPDARIVETAPLYGAFRNTLILVILLFAVYLGFEFERLWLGTFPDGFYYSGFAHEGAAWLTVALILASLILSLIFRGAVLRDPQLPRLRRLAWVWSVENLLLAVAVYHRLLIYIGFNGMTRMRVVGLYGMTAVVVGFLTVLWKISKQRDFGWLVRRHLWTLGVAIYVYSVTPVDRLVMRYNVDRILGGDPAPSVQITEHPVDAEGYFAIEPLVDCSDPLIREGTKAMLARRLIDCELRTAQNRRYGWTAHQISESWLLERLRSSQGRWPEYADVTRRDAAIQAFRTYAYQWY